MAQSNPMNRRTLLAFATWAATAAAAIGAGTAAISVLGAGITDRTVKPMTAAEVNKALANPYSPSAALSSTPPSSPPALHPKAAPAPRVTVTQTVTAAVTRSLSSPGGSVVVRCDRQLAYLISWSPAQGFGVGRTGRGPADQVSVQFEAGPVRFTMTIACHGGAPEPIGGFNWGRTGHWPVPGLGDLRTQIPSQYDQGGQ